MRDFGDDSSAGSTPPPSNVDGFSPSGFFADENDLLAAAVPPSAAGDELWTHLELDGWCFNSDNHHQTEQIFRPAASDPVRQKSGCGSRRPPRPSRAASSVRETNKRKKNPMITRFDNHHSQSQDCDHSVGNWNSVVQSLASENDKDDISSMESDESEIQSDLPANEKRPPEIGMEFLSEEEAYKFYKRYADEVGFSVRKGKVQRLTNGTIRKRNYLCTRQGFKSKKPSSNNNEESTTTAKYKRKETRTGCNASIQFTVEEGNKWIVSSFVPDHNHILEEKNDRKENDSLHCLPNKEQRQHDVQTLMNCFLKSQAEDVSFFYGIQVDAVNRAVNFFWRDSRSMSDYAHFRDVVVFETTLRAENVVCASFWGVNHHRQRILFGSALLLDQTLESFLWLFRVLSVAMDDLPPKTLYVTDESREITIAVETAFPKTKYRLSANNIVTNAKTRFPGYFDHNGFEDAFHDCVYNSQSKEEFESKWDSLLVRYDLRENSWLVNVRGLWENWSGEKIFSAGIEVLFKDVLRKLDNETVSLHGFFRKQVEEAKKMRSLELQEDQFHIVRSRKGMEKHAGDLYTRTIFEKFRDELLDSISLEIEEVTSSANVSAFKLKEEGQVKEYIVTFDSSNSYVACSCGNFETIGILCGHCLKVLNSKKIFQIPPQYVLRRWTKSAKERVSSGSESYSRNIMHKTLDLVAKSKDSVESRNMVEGYLDLALKKADEILKEKVDPEQRYLTNKKTISNSSLANQEQGSKNTSRSVRKKNTHENNVEEIGFRFHGDLVTKSAIESTAFFQSQHTGVFFEDSALDQTRQAESQSTSQMPSFYFYS